MGGALHVSSRVFHLNGTYQYWVGPILGSFLGASFYATMNIDYGKLNPGQDATNDLEAARVMEEVPQNGA
ncbi:hypothetical protein C0992_009246 [Termitomyces sp. T32_za158]|nr:hypothetical protein C0992_009246 [Termitomyces sp. T32_za158]